MDETIEVIFVGLPGPTHNYGGLSGDNVASSKNRGQVSSPQQAALQALDLVRLLTSLGIPAGVLPPQLRPHLPLLQQHFVGDADEVITQAAQQQPALLEKACSSSAMWVANAGTATPGLDNSDGALHITTANLHTNLHRRIEAEDTHKTLTQLFAQAPDVVIHPPLAESMPDEGAANHMRLAPRHNAKGLHVLVYGKDGSPDDAKTARQSKAAYEEIVAVHGLPENQFLLVKQNPSVIDDGVFHNDVIAVSNENVLLAHAEAYANGAEDIARIEAAYNALHSDSKLHTLVIRDDQLSVKEAVHTYLFNSQIVTKADGNMAIIAPTEVRDLFGSKAAKLLDSIVADNSNPIDALHYADLRQSMQNGGGPACLRLRVPMTRAQLTALKEHTGAMANDDMLNELARLIEAHYPMQLPPRDVKDPALYQACQSFLMSLAKLLKIRLVE